MPDMEVVMKSLRRCSDMTICPADCYYRRYAPDCIEKLHRDAINLLKNQNELLKQQAELLEEQEAVGWIKVSDRLPFSSQMVLVSYPAYTDEAGNQYVEGVGIGYLITTATNKYWCRSDGTTFGELGFSSVNPIAWMPIPSPMKGGEQDATD